MDRKKTQSPREKAIELLSFFYNVKLDNSFVLLSTARMFALKVCTEAKLFKQSEKCIDFWDEVIDELNSIEIKN